LRSSDIVENSMRNSMNAIFCMVRLPHPFVLLLLSLTLFPLRAITLYIFDDDIKTPQLHSVAVRSESVDIHTWKNHFPSVFKAKEVRPLGS